MSDNENPASKQTSSVPLKKETVRVTLKAADAPSASPGGSPPAPAAPKPPAGPPKAPSPPAPGKPPSATAPVATVGPPKAPAPAPTIPLRTAAGTGAPSAPSPAPTIRLNTPANSPGPPMAGSGAPTAPMRPPGAPTAPGGAPTPGPTIALPKATVQLNPPTQPLGTQAPAASQMATMPVSEEEDSGSSPIANVLAILGFLGAAAVIAVQLMTANVWLTKDDQGKSRPAEWGRLF